MPTIKVTIKHTETATIDTGDLPASLIRDVLVKQKDGTFDGNWGLGDLSAEWVVDSIEVEEV